MIHRVTLNNGRVLLIEEDDNCLHFADVEGPTDDLEFPPTVGSYICTLNPSGVLVMPNSGGATADLTEKLKKRRLYALVSAQGTADADTCLCEDHFETAHRSTASKNALAKADIPDVEKFQDCTQNDALHCIFCGEPKQVDRATVIRRGLAEASRALTELDPTALEHDAAAIDDAMEASGQ